MNQFLFAPFRLDLSNQQLHRGGAVIPLRPKSFAVLKYLLEHAGRLVTKQELLDVVWPETSITDSVLKISVREIREALEDDARTPRFIQTVHGSGYRFIANVTTDSLPSELTTFVGRDSALVTVTGLMQDARLLTLTGPGGVGKTRLALRLARRVMSRYEDGVLWADLAALSNARFVPQTVATLLGIRKQPECSIESSLQRHLRPKHLLLVLDNCEHVLEACATLVVGLLSACPGVRIITTSREPLGTTGEQVWTVPPLTSPSREAIPSMEGMAGYESVRLFLERASLAEPEFTLTPDNAPTLAQICCRLDGIPLAIELAASRVRALTVEQIARRLDDAFLLLAHGNRSETARHQTLRATMDWSYGLLTGREQHVFASLAVFAGGWRLEAAEAVCPSLPPAPGEPQTGEVLDLVVRLVDKSLVVAGRRSEGEMRYGFLETVRQYARTKLLESTAFATVQSRHARYYLEFAETIEPRINTASRATWLSQMDADHDNLRAALRWAIHEDPECALRLSGALRWFWFHRGYWTEGRGWLHEALTIGASADRGSLRAKALLGSGVLAWTQGDRAVARCALEQSVAISRTLSDDRLLSEGMHFLGNEMLAQGDARECRLAAEQSIALYRRNPGEKFGLAVTLATLGIAAMAQADYGDARRALEESADICRETGDQWALSLPLRKPRDRRVSAGRLR